MENANNEIANMGISEIVALASSSLVDAYSEHGDAAIDLVLMIYRLDAFEQVGIGLISIIAMISIILAITKNAAKINNVGLEEYEVLNPIWFPIGFALIFAFLFLASISSGAFNPFAWAAVIGYPEAYIASKALIAAGLL